jgi:hypothetical protein
MIEFRVSVRYWSKGQFQNRGINPLSAIPPGPVAKQPQSSRVEDPTLLCNQVEASTQLLSLETGMASLSKNRLC